MDNSKLISLLRTFDAKDLRLFGDFVRSPFYNKNVELARLYEQLRKTAPEFPAHKIDKYLIWTQLYPDLAPDEKEISYLMNFLLKLAERYIGMRRYQEDTFMPEFHILEAYSGRGLDKHYRHKHRQLGKLLSGHPYQNERHYYNAYEMASLDARFIHLKQQRTVDHHLRGTVDHLDRYYLATRLRLTCELINRRNILSAEYDQEEVDKLLNYLHTHESVLELPVIGVYYYQLRMLIEPEQEQFFHSFKALLSENGSLLPPLELKEVYVYAQNYCIRRIRQGAGGFLKELFEIYQEALKAGTLLESDGYLSPWKFKNIVSVALRLGETDWAEGFIEEFLPELPVEFRESASAYNIAHIRYHQKEYAQALKTLQAVEFSDLYYSLDTRKMMLRIYFEQADTEPLLSLIAAFKIFLKRNKLISDGNRAAYRNFVDWVYRLERMREKGQVVGPALQMEIRDTQPLVDEEWLIQTATAMD